LQKLNQINYYCKKFEAPFNFSNKDNAKCVPLQNPHSEPNKMGAKKTKQ